MTEPYRARSRYTDQAVVDEYDDRRFSSLRGRHYWRREQAGVGAMIAAAGRADRVLDCPSGNGRWVTVLRRLQPTTVVEADVSGTMLRASAAREPGLPAVQCEGERLPFADDAFDLVFCHALLKHLPPPTQARVLAELARVSSRHVVVALSVDEGLPGLVRKVRNLRHSGLSNAVRPDVLHQMVADAGLRLVDQRSCTTALGLERSVLLELV